MKKNSLLLFLSGILLIGCEQKGSDAFKPYASTDLPKTGSRVGFEARSVLGGYWMKVLMEKMKKIK